MDRNTKSCRHEFVKVTSLSARRAWIEIITVLASEPEEAGRSPQGERG